MSSIMVKGGRALEGKIAVQGSKNAVLPIISAALMCDKVILKNCPDILDVNNMLLILSKLGMRAVWLDKSILVIEKIEDDISEISQELTRQLRASVLLAGTLLGKYKGVILSYPGGCTIGERPIDIHLKAFEDLGARICKESESIKIDGTDLHSGTVELAFPSVGATENILLLASQIAGETIVYNAAKEPEIDELIRFLKALGSDITRENEKIIVRGKVKRKAVEFEVCSDRIVAGTYILAAIATSGEIELYNAPVEHLEALLKSIDKMGSFWHLEEGGRLLIKGSSSVSPLNIITNPYPDFPTDLQSQIMAVLTKAEGKSIIEENIFENRFKISSELNKMGADIDIKKNRAYICGKKQLYGNKVVAKDLRGTAALIIAGLMARGDTIVCDSDYINRGYCDICMDLKKLGAVISYD